MGYIGWRMERAAARGVTRGSAGIVKYTALLFWWMLAWPFYLAGWGIRHRGEVAQAGRATADAGRQVREHAQKHPKRAAWAGLVAGLVFCAGGIGGGTVLGAVIFGAVAAWCGYLLLKWRQAEKKTALAAVAARADYEHHLAADGDIRGLYGQYPPTA
ncbi:hypothetical protein [Tomitella cavernea]|uniref:Uncharacterized protein n=1 Tax=Tomitella cavernea TaxID=1387982 RepID=A0ABP9D8M1_9ACTN|nr:hypothetical protein [Tomitella cavernea]